MLNKIKEEYKNIYLSDLEEKIKKNTSGYFQKLLITLLNSNRRKNKDLDKKKCDDICNKLLVETNTEDDIFNIFNDYLGECSPAELVKISRGYHRKKGKILDALIEGTFSGSILELIKTILFANISPSEYFSQRIKEGLNNTNTLNRVIVVRNEIDIPKIKEYYKIKNRNNDLEKDIKKKLKDENEYYLKLLLELLNKK